jgi:hypothetical protein
MLTRLVGPHAGNKPLAVGSPASMKPDFDLFAVANDFGTGPTGEADPSADRRSNSWSGPAQPKKSGVAEGSSLAGPARLGPTKRRTADRKPGAAPAPAPAPAPLRPAPPRRSSGSDMFRPPKRDTSADLFRPPSTDAVDAASPKSIFRPPNLPTSAGSSSYRQSISSTWPTTCNRAGHGLERAS